ncbi:MAG: histone deacetylase family protein [Fidelibacterota bacterium]|jgi:acetoin utilization deacetylase AcuC-like enzyme|tara:strand:- start:1206 stop:2129 length:924 start_codon:yes stop_codon:yes gene_type:complete
MPGLNIYYHPLYTDGIDSKSRFPRERYKLIYELLQESDSKELINFISSPICKKEDLLLAHDKIFVEKFLTNTLSTQEKRKIGLQPWNNHIIERTMRIMGGSVSAVDSAIKGSISANMAGGTHHAFHHYGAGYCVFNDLAVSAYVAKRDFNIQKILIIDLDVHQGDGTASILKEDKNTFTFSMHSEKNYPLKKEKSDLDISLLKDTNDSTYLEILEKNLKKLENVKSEMIFFQAGVDTLKSDNLGYLSLSHSGLKIRNKMILRFAEKRENPIVVFMGGGYSRPIDDTVLAFRDLFIQCALYAQKNKVK